jgi:hypothetical protein
MHAFLSFRCNHLHSALLFLEILFLLAANPSHRHRSSLPPVLALELVLVLVLVLALVLALEAEVAEVLPQQRPSSSSFSQ